MYKNARLTHIEGGSSTECPTSLDKRDLGGDISFYSRGGMQSFIETAMGHLFMPGFNKEVQHLEELAYSWYSEWLWEKDTGISVLRNETG